MESRWDRTGQKNILLSCPISPRLHARSRLYEFSVFDAVLNNSPLPFSLKNEIVMAEIQPTVTLTVTQFPGPKT